MSAAAPFASAAERNARPILGVIEHELSDATSVLEIGTGTAQQTVVFARYLPLTLWQTSDLTSNHEGIRARLTAAGLDNVRHPLCLDVRDAKAEAAQYDAVYSSNTAHIMDEPTVEAMFRYVAVTLRESGSFLLYGPFRLNGGFTTESNARFDQSLRRQDPTMGIRDLEWLDILAARRGMRRHRLYSMPANNFLVVWKKDRTYPDLSRLSD